MVCMEEPRLRRAYVKLSWPSFYDYVSPVGSIILEREHDGEEVLSAALDKSPGTASAFEVSQAVRLLAASPVAEVRGFSRYGVWPGCQDRCAA